MSRVAADLLGDYITAGGAYGNVNATTTTAAGVALASASSGQLGWTFGAGLEYAFMGNWSAKLEYLYVDLGTKSYFNSTQDVRFRDHIVRAGVNYAFSPTAVVAKY